MRVQDRMAFWVYIARMADTGHTENFRRRIAEYQTGVIEVTCVGPYHVDVVEKDQSRIEAIWKTAEDRALVTRSRRKR
jgi:hypothetical protein